MQPLAVKRTNSTDTNFRKLVTELDQVLRQRNGEDMMDVYDQFNVIEKIDTVVIAYWNDEPVGCGCFKPFDNEAVEIKRMYVRDVYRGKGISKALLATLETWAKELDYHFTVLETGTKQIEAISLYERYGYQRIPKYGPYINLPDSICYRKQLL
ncbi:GNAT family N-acetyltransferase [Mucilaginibacter lacusdianchii]|uniref:GNAT family N-acetyltransferase n=1 Tax=Mucilaginibacter lacusdianchii TaxID=2684211 RepID=UPI00131B9493|nr:GNAT family N-acetyltransferase [Mucilaginibacter sp. JXJ CY 39]